MLRNQLKQLQDELRQTDRNLTKSQANKQVLMGKIGKNEPLLSHVFGNLPFFANSAMQLSTTHSEKTNSYIIMYAIASTTHLTV